MRHPFHAVTPQSLGLAALLFGGFVVALFVASKVLPGRREPGARLADGTRRTYKLNGLLIFVCIIVVMAAGTWSGRVSLVVLYRHFWSFFVIANGFALALAVFLYRRGRPAADGWLRGLVLGTELNPTCFGVDLKLFSYRPSLIGLGLLNASFAVVQYERYGQVSTSMGLFQLFAFFYVANYFQFEYGMLYTWDIMAERFGLMLVWGDYVLVPCFYSLPGWYLIERLEPLPLPVVVGLCLLFTVGFWLFRGANQQKHRYKTAPGAIIWGKPAATIGGQLLVSGFWGIGPICRRV